VKNDVEIYILHYFFKDFPRLLLRDFPEHEIQALNLVHF